MTCEWRIAAAVLVAHVVALALITRSTHFRDDIQFPQEPPVATAGFIIDKPRITDTVPIPEVTLDLPRMNSRSIRLIQFESEDWGDISQVVAPSSAPQLSRFQPVDPAILARQAGLAPGQAASVVLTVEVLPDGTVGRIEIARTSGDLAVDAAAVAYGRALRWVPGTREHRAEAMRISLPVTLVWTA